ncbi:Putative Zinc finger, RING-type [Septoria linicola]|uniref:Zinc finger, RING-type n=1 Tax=Septoria linicola TaxID=215465 RepID=A0A9Q9EPU5_9PEZI|nr:Putative Zinc finger, RING-type [Septoria linicola]
MTPEQLAALVGAEAGDLVLVTTPPSQNLANDTPQPETWQLLLIDSVRTVGMTTHLTIHTHSLLPEDWLSYRQNPRSFRRMAQSSVPATSSEHHFFPASEVLLRPSFDDLHDTIFYGTCPWLHCDHELVIVNSRTETVLRCFAEPALRFGSALRGLCPFCMGGALYRHHEEILGRFRMGVGDDVMEEHIARVDARRVESRYAPLHEVAVLDDLRSEVEAGESERQAYTAAEAGAEGEVHRSATTQGGPSTLADISDVLPGAEAGPSPDFFRQTWFTQLDGSVQRQENLRRMSEAAIAELRRFMGDPPAPATTRSIPALTLPPPAITGPVQAVGSVVPNLRVREWYDKATERVLSGECYICLERFGSGEIVADLPCWHFFHADCWSHVVGGKCPFRCNEDRIPTSD